jgi:hypothetical protein
MSRQSDLAPAIQEIKREFLQVIREDIAQLVYLASTRDYHNRCYHHDVLAYHFSNEMADQALAACHREVFERLTLSPLEEIVRQLENYLSSSMMPLEEVLRTWNKLAPYRVLPPCDCEPLLAELFYSNIKVALTILLVRRKN